MLCRNGFRVEGFTVCMLKKWAIRTFELARGTLYKFVDVRILSVHVHVSLYRRMCVRSSVRKVLLSIIVCM